MWLILHNLATFCESPSIWWGYVCKLKIKCISNTYQWFVWILGIFRHILFLLVFCRPSQMVFHLEHEMFELRSTLRRFHCDSMLVKNCKRTNVICWKTTINLHRKCCMLFFFYLAVRLSFLSCFSPPLVFIFQLRLSLCCVVYISVVTALTSLCR